MKRKQSGNNENIKTTLFIMSLDTPTALHDLGFDIQAILGAAVFDCNGLPKDYFTSADYQDISWVQTAFQALGLRSLLISSLQLDTFHYAIVHGTQYCAVVTKQHEGYVAIIVAQNVFHLQTQRILNWVQQLHPRIFAETAHLRPA